MKTINICFLLRLIVFLYKALLDIFLLLLWTMHVIIVIVDYIVVLIEFLGVNEFNVSIILGVLVNKLLHESDLLVD